MATQKTPSGKKTFNFAAGLSNLGKASEAAAVDRFATASKVIETRPDAFTDTSGMPPAQKAASTDGEFDIAHCIVGQTYDVPLHLIDPNPFGARYFYVPQKVEEIVEALLEDNQSVAVNGYVKDGRVILIDGGTRLKGAKSAGFATLQVKIEEEPTTKKELYRRSAQLNEQRSAHTALDKAFMFQRMLDEGVYANQTELANDQIDDSGKPMTLQTLAAYMRVAKIPEHWMKKLADHPQTSKLYVAYEIADIFLRPEYAQDPDRYNLIAQDVIKAVQEGELGKKETKALVSARLDGPKSRETPMTNDVRFGERVGKVKVFPERGEFQLSFNGLTKAQLEDVKQRVEKALTGQLSQ